MHRVGAQFSGEDWSVAFSHAEKPSQEPEIRLYFGAGRLFSVCL